MFAALNSFLTGALAKVTDVYWPFVSMLLHGDSAQQFNQDTSTNVFPISDSAVAVYSVASMQASTRTPFTGGPSSSGSGFFNGTNAGLSIPTNAAFTLGSTQTTEMWVYATASTYQTLITFYSAAGQDVLLYNGKVVVYGGAATTTASFPLNAWTHLAVVFTSGTLTIYFNGVSQAFTGSSTGYNYTTSSTVYIGNQNGNAGFFSQGYISNLRVVKGVAVYTGNFTVPTAALAATQSSGTNISAITGTQTSLLTLQTNVPQNNNQFFDTSTNNFTVTRNGNTTQGSFNPFVSTYPYAVATNGGSAYFDGTGDYLSLAANAAFTIPVSTSFTIEAWIYITDLAYANGNIICANSSTSSGYVFLYNPTIGLRLYAGGGAVDINQGAVTGWAANTWYHVAAVRNGASAITLYRNGVSVATGSSTSSFGTGAYFVGASPNSPDLAYMNGYISNFRLVNGTAVYTTSFTPPTAPLTAVTNTALLLGMSNGAIYDNAELNNLETVASAQISTSTFKYGTGALKFNGTTDYLLISPANQAAFTFGSGDFTIEMWYQVSGNVGPGVLYSANTPASSLITPFIYVQFLQIFYSSDGGSTNSISGGTQSANVWRHLAVCRSGTSTKMFINGTQVGATYTDTRNYVTSSLMGLGANTGNLNQYFGGYIDDFRVTKGIARYTATFTPPTAAFPNQAPTYPSGTATQRAIFGFGTKSAAPYVVSITNTVSNTGVVSGDDTSVGSARGYVAAAGYGGDKAIFGFGYISGNVSMTNLVSNTGVVATNTTGVGTARASAAAAGYGSTGQAIFGYGSISSDTAITNLVSNTGVVATDTTGVGTARSQLAAAKYSTDKAVFGYGTAASVSVSMTNKVSNTGVVATDTTGVGTARYGLAAAGYGTTGQAIFAYGNTGGSTYVSMSNLVSNTGVVSADTTGVGTARAYLAASAYGGDKAIFGYGNQGFFSSMTNLVSSTGVVASDTTGVGTARPYLAAAGFSYS